MPLGRGVVRREGRRLAILGFGTLTAAAMAVAEALDATLVDMRFVKPLDEPLLLELAGRHQAFVTLEEAAVMGGAGSAVLECFSREGIPLPVLQLGIPDRFIDHGDQSQLLAGLGLDSRGIHQAIVDRFPELAGAAHNPSLS